MTKSKEFNQILQNSIERNKLSQVYLLSAKQNVDLDSYVIEMINKINDETFVFLESLTKHPIYFLIDGKEKTISKDTMLEAMKQLTESKLSEKKSKKILIVKQIDNASAQTLNALLKFLESPPQDAIVILTTNAINRVLKTIKSRAFLLTIYEKNDEEIVDPFSLFFKEIASPQIPLNEIKSDANIQLINELKEALTNSYKNQYAYILFITEKLNKNNAYVLLSALQYFYRDIFLYNSSSKFEFMFLTKKEISKIATFGEYEEVYKIVLNFKKSLTTNENFIIQKANFIAKLGELYGL
ncbi:DNA polymerase-3 subunit delta' [Metamycoplasma subdolum]|uniref:DNA polymerase-3 subunit delta n=1 Tax=Metamycoplasma subdolum TaxID=92407 RepID=A0A3M0A741_9BACT|nr:hypothetical protein [Metamycoplasma subdolum]RMA78628.1 DNA polymerase-3 subunit delta' [Metamycoplasma subdolum]WPB50770.1 hypothetical protein R9C05_01325 [Metamycoplasma subdolum]